MIDFISIPAANTISNSTTTVFNCQTHYMPYYDEAFMDVFSLTSRKQGCRKMPVTVFLGDKEHDLYRNYEKHEDNITTYCLENHVKATSKTDRENSYAKFYLRFIKESFFDAPLDIVPAPFADAVLKYVPQMISAANGATGCSYYKLLGVCSGKMTLPDAVVFYGIYQKGSIFRIYPRPTNESSYTDIYLPATHRPNPDIDVTKLNDVYKDIYTVLGVLMMKNCSDSITSISREWIFRDNSHYAHKLPFVMSHLDSPYLRELVEDVSLTPEDINIQIVKKRVMFNGEYI